MPALMAAVALEPSLASAALSASLRIPWTVSRPVTATALLAVTDGAA